MGRDRLQGGTNTSSHCSGQTALALRPGKCILARPSCWPRRDVQYKDGSEGKMSLPITKQDFERHGKLANMVIAFQQTIGLDYMGYQKLNHVPVAQYAKRGLAVHKFSISVCIVNVNLDMGRGYTKFTLCRFFGCYQGTTGCVYRILWW